MKLKMIIKSIFVTVLSLILVALAVIAFMKIDKTDDLYSLTGKKDYRILDNIDSCEEKFMDCFYKEGETYYCFECRKSTEVLLEWSDGSQTRMIDDLEKGNVTIESLIANGLLKNDKATLYSFVAPIEFLVIVYSLK